LGGGSDGGNGDGGERVLRLGRSSGGGGGHGSDSDSDGDGDHQGPGEGALRLAATGDGGLEWRGKVRPCAQCCSEVRADADARRAAFANATLKVCRLNEGAPVPEPAAAGAPGNGVAGPRRTARSAAGADASVTGVGSNDKV
jgi:hypothetical protein